MHKCAVIIIIITGRYCIDFIILGRNLLISGYGLLIAIVRLITKMILNYYNTNREA